MPLRPLCASLISLATLGVAACAVAEAAPRRLPPLASAPAPASRPLQTAVFSGGCFWGVQGVFSHVKGVSRAVSGYAGGMAATARYELVSTGLTRHAEAVEVSYDPKQVSYADLLRVFFSVALDPTEVDRQGPDAGSQYRSVVWAANAEQKREAEGYIRQLNGARAFPAAIATTVQPLHGFYMAEAHHQDFLARHPNDPYVQAWDAGKVTALKTLYPSMFTAQPARGV